MLSLGLWLGAHETLLCHGTSFEVRNEWCLLWRMQPAWEGPGPPTAVLSAGPHVGPPSLACRLTLTYEEELGFRGRELDTSLV